VRLLADENVDGALVVWLRARGHDVRYAAEDVRATPDNEVLKIATEEGRVVLTGDRDFGELVFRRKQVAVGLVLIRIQAESQEERLGLFRAHWAEVERRVVGAFVVVTADRLRVRPLAR
jgi:predicted nuclease of predicted toxin-antitoxin system